MRNIQQKPRFKKKAMAADVTDVPPKVSHENYRDMTDSDVEGAFHSLAHEHDPIAADNLIRFFHFALKDDSPLFANCRRLGQMEQILLQYVGYAFGRYVDGKPLDAAFGLKRSSGRQPVTNNWARDLNIAAKVELNVRMEREEKRKRGSQEQAGCKLNAPGKKSNSVGKVKMEPICTEVAKEMTIGWKSVEKIYREHKDGVGQLDCAMVTFLAEHLIK